jgi:Chromosome segregation ATPases
MASNNYDLILRFIMDQSSQQKTKAGVDALTGEIGDVDKILDAVNKDFDTLDKKIKEATSVKEIEGLQRQLKDVEKQVTEITKAYSLQARVLRAEAASLTSDFEKARLAQIKSIGDQIGRASGGALVAGGAILGGAFAESNRFAKEAEDTGKATQATREWTRATQELAQARARVDTVLLRETLPLLKQAARVANEAAAFVEKNPEIVSAALKTGEVLVALGAVGVAVSKGIRLYADVQALALGTQQLTAAKLQDTAADKQLIAARIRAGVDVPGAAKTAEKVVGGASLLRLGPLAAILSGAALYSGIGRAASNFGARAFGFESPEVFWKLIGEKLHILKQEADKTAASVQNAATGLGGLSSEMQQKVASAWQSWQEDDAKLVQDAADKRVKIVADSEKRVADETKKYTSQVSKINESANKRAASITANYLQATAQDEANYQEQRAKIIKDGGKEIREIEADHQERLRELTKEHAERVQDLTASRDALGLAKEQRRFSEQQEEENRNTRIEIAKRRQDLAERLAELDHEHAAEQAQRLAQFQQDLAENEAQRKEQLQEAAAAHAEELRQIHEQRMQQLRELQEGLNAERARRREVFIAEIRDLDASLLGEKNLKVKYYNAMLTDADVWLAKYRAKLASVGGSTSTTMAPMTAHAAGGYTAGVVRTGEMGVEYLLSNRTTRAAENIIGGGLTQDALLNTLARGAGSGRSLTIHENSRFDGRISSAEVRMIRRDTRDEIIKEFLGT